MDEKMRILKMVEEGTITAEQAAELMDAMCVDAGGETALAAGRDDYGKKMFRIIVDSDEGDKVNIQFPVKAIKKILKVTGKLPIPAEELEGVDLNEIMEAVSECLDDEILGDFVNVQTADGTKVKIFVDKG